MLTQARLKEVLDYNPQTGIFIHKRAGSGITALSKAGCINAHGYNIIVIDNVGYKASKLAWLYVHGYLPTKIIDHKNRNKCDDRIDNLREASHSQNSCNRAIQSNNSVGIKGIIPMKTKKGDTYAYRARIRVNKQLYQKTFNLDSLTEAVEWLAKLRTQLHGEFACS